MSKRLHQCIILTLLVLFSAFLSLKTASGASSFPEEFASEIVYQSQTPLTGALAITDLNSDSGRELVFADWNGKVFLKEEGKEGASIVFSEEPDEEGENPVMGIEQPGGNFTGENQVMVYGYSGAVRILTFDSSLALESTETVFTWEAELFAMAKGDLLKNVSGEELYFGDWKTPHIIVLWREGGLWEHFVLNTSAPVKSLLYTDFDPTLPGGELYATLDYPQNSTLIEIWMNSSGGIVQKSLLTDRFLLTNVKEANLLDDDQGAELVVTSLSGKAYHLSYSGGVLREEVIYDTEGEGGLEGLSTGPLSVDGEVNVTVMTGYSNILALGIEVGGNIETRVVWSSPNIKEFELAGVLIGDFDSTIDGNEIYVTAYTGYIAKIYYAEGMVSLKILDEEGEPVDRLELYPGYLSCYTLSATIYTPGNISGRIIIKGDNSTIFTRLLDEVKAAPEFPLSCTLFIELLPGTPEGNYTLYVFINHSGNSFLFTYPVEVKKVKIEELMVEPEVVDIDLFVDDPVKVDVTFRVNTTPIYRFLLPSVAVVGAPGALNYSVESRSDSVKIAFTINGSREPSALPGNHTYILNISVADLSQEVAVRAHVFSLREVIRVKVKGIQPGSKYILIEVNTTSPLHSDLKLFAGMRRGGVGGGPYESFTLKGEGGEVLLTFPEPLKEGEDVEVFLYTPRGTTIYESQIEVKGESEEDGEMNYILTLSFAALIIGALLIAVFYWVRLMRAKRTLEE